jgi:hypothetical protein
MKILGTLAMAALTQTGFAGNRQESTVTVCTENLPQIGLLAESRAAKMFAAASVQIAWQSGRSCPTNAIRVRFTSANNPSEFPGAFAYALPYGGTTIVVFYDRVQQSSPQTAGRSAVLAHVLVHEITHILQGFAGHSAEGVMKSSFTAADLSGMVFAPLPFTNIDVFLLQQGLVQREARQAASR